MAAALTIIIIIVVVVVVVIVQPLKTIEIKKAHVRPDFESSLLSLCPF